MAPVIQVIDSRDNDKIVFVIVDKCVVPVLKAKINDIEYIIQIVDEKCHLRLAK